MDIFNKEENIKYCQLLNSTGWKTLDKLKRGSLSHYTTPNAVYNILSNEKLWFTDYRYLNDSSEGEFIWDILDKIFERNHYEKKFIDSIKELKNEQAIRVNEIGGGFSCEKYIYYICSFSKNNDSLSLWNYYARTTDSSGYNLVFNKAKLVNTVVEKNRLEKHDCALMKVLYRGSEQVKCLTPIIDFFYNTWLSFRPTKRALLMIELYYLIQKLALGFKHKAYEDEKEVRLVLTLTEEDNQKFYDEKLIEMRVKGNYFIPYLSLSIDRSALDKIVASPYIKDKTALESLKLLTQKLELPNRDIILSEIPARF